MPKTSSEALAERNEPYPRAHRTEKFTLPAWGVVAD
jgi:hypothetical protein